MILMVYLKAYRIYQLLQVGFQNQSQGSLIQNLLRHFQAPGKNVTRYSAGRCLPVIFRITFLTKQHAPRNGANGILTVHLLTHATNRGTPVVEIRLFRVLFVGGLLGVALAWAGYWLGFERGYVIGLKAESYCAIQNIARTLYAQQSTEPGSLSDLELKQRLELEVTRLKVNETVIEEMNFSAFLLSSLSNIESYNELYSNSKNRDALTECILREEKTTKKYMGCRNEIVHYQ